MAAPHRAHSRTRVAIWHMCVCTTSFGCHSEWCTTSFRRHSDGDPASTCSPVTGEGRPGIRVAFQGEQSQCILVTRELWSVRVYEKRGGGRERETKVNCCLAAHWCLPLQCSLMRIHVDPPIVFVCRTPIPTCVWTGQSWGIYT